MKQQEALLHAAKCETEAVGNVLAEERLQAKNLIRAFCRAFFFCETEAVAIVLAEERLQAESLRRALIERI
jgi:hypothetical protein